MKILTALVLSVVSVGLVGSGCASDESSITSTRGPGTASDAGAGAAAGAAGAAGTTGTGGATAGTGGATTGSCNPSFCPETGGGVACCVTANGPCGVDFGNGCVGTMPDGG